VAGHVAATEGAISYVELDYAKSNKLSAGAVQNKDGKFVTASPEAVTAASKGAEANIPDDLTLNLNNQPGEKAYPISAFTYLIVYSDLRNLKTKDEAEGLIGFITWALQDGQKFATSMDYAPLSQGVQDAALKALRTVTFQGKPVTISGR